jgi:hypothetical protein
MSENRKRVLEMLASGKISVEEASQLLSALKEEDADTGAKPAASAGKVRALRIVVDAPPEEVSAGKPAKINIRVPIALIRAGMKFSSLIPEEASDKVDEALKGKGIKINLKNLKEEDIEALIIALSELEVDIDEGKGKVRIYTECC